MSKEDTTRILLGVLRNILDECRIDMDSLTWKEVRWWYEEIQLKGSYNLLCANRSEDG